ncbi:hypothetical protein MKW92_012987 [Papaver armeniacum]|nr:hypothetical protein MKW92_012987 [Papaver armeniacum]
MKKYVPPHKRHLKDGAKALEGSSLNTHSLAHKFQQKRKDRVASFGGKYAYAKSCVSRMCIVDSTEKEDLQYSGSITLEHISLESILYKKHGRTPYVLVSSHKKKGTNELNKNSYVENPLISVAEQILPNLLAFQNKSVEGSSKEFEEGKICFVARFGKVLFHGIPSLTVDTLLDKSRYEASLGRIFRSFNTNVPRSFTESVLNVVVPGIGVDFDGEKEYYYVRVADKSCADVLSCKCTAAGVGGIELQKIETNNVRHVIVDAACVEEDLDLRLMLYTRKIVTEVRDEAKHDLEKLIKSAVVDRNAKGGLRFPLGNESSKGRYRVVGIGHTKTRAFKNSSIRVKLNEVDRYDFITSTPEVTNHVVLKMTGISEKLKANNLESNQLAKMLEDNMKLIWSYFLRLECCFA